MMTTLAFDVYGTLIDTHGVISALQPLLGERAAAFSQSWRDKQLEYSFRRGLMQNYVSFADCTRQALLQTATVYRQSLSDAQIDTLLGVYRVLPAFADAASALPKLNAAGFRCFAFSNGNADAVETLLVSAGIREHFQGVVSVDDLKTFKPSPAVYAHFLRQSGTGGAEAWMISGNPFDVIGALSAGMRAAWVKRSPDAVFDPWGIEPTVTVASLDQLPDAIGGYTA